VSTLVPPALRWFLTAQGGSHRLSEQLPLDAQPPVAAAGASLFVDTGRRFQALEGFGAAFTEAAAVTWQALDEATRHRFLIDCFSADAGHGYRLCRVHMNSCDFALGNYAHADTPGDMALDGFTIERDRQALLPFIQAALRVAGQPIKLLVSPWSPPAWMKTVSVQNEPAATQRWDSCLYTAEEERDFVRDHLGPALAAAGLARVRIIVWDHNRDLLVERASVVYADPAAARFVWGAGFHWYGEDHFDHVQLLHDAWPDKQLLFTEGCQEGGPHHGDWAVGERYARSIIKDLNRWTCGWIDWNLLLDETGGPNHAGNLCSAPVMADRASGALLHQGAYFYLGHFARFVHAGSRRVLCAASLEALEATAWAQADGSAAVVAMNRTTAPLAFTLCLDGQHHAAALPPRAIATFIRAAR